MDRSRAKPPRTLDPDDDEYPEPSLSETLAMTLFRTRLRERLPQFGESTGVGHNQGGIVFSWPARKGFIAYISMQLHRRKPGFTVESGWSRGEVDSFFKLGTPRWRQLGERVRLGHLMPSGRDRWWWLFPDELTPTRRRAVARAAPKWQRAFYALWRKEVKRTTRDAKLRAQTVALIDKREDEQLRVEAGANESPDEIAAIVQARVDDAVEQIVAYGLPWLAGRAAAKRTSLPGIAPPTKKAIRRASRRPLQPILMALRLFRKRLAARLRRFRWVGIAKRGIVYVWRVHPEFFAYVVWRSENLPEPRFAVDVGWTPELAELTDFLRDSQTGEQVALGTLAPDSTQGWYSLAVGEQDSMAEVTRLIQPRVEKAIDRVTRAGLRWLRERAAARGVRMPRS